MITNTTPKVRVTPTINQLCPSGFSWCQPDEMSVSWGASKREHYRVFGISQRQVWGSPSAIMQYLWHTFCMISLLGYISFSFHGLLSLASMLISFLFFFVFSDKCSLNFSGTLELNKSYYLKKYCHYIFHSHGSERKKEKSMQTRLRKEAYVHRKPMQVGRARESQGLMNLTQCNALQG